MLQFKKHLCNPNAFSGIKLFSATRKVASSDFAKKMAMFVVMFMLAAIDTWASSTGAGGFTKATTEISSYQTPVANLMKAIAAVIVLVGAFNVYFKMQNGDQDVKKTIMMTIGGCVAFIAMSEALPLFFK
jgi:hypothetical protein